jgi:hypothetical protein
MVGADCTSGHCEMMTCVAAPASACR